MFNEEIKRSHTFNQMIKELPDISEKMGTLLTFCLQHIYEMPETVLINPYMSI